jgi:hypothetical protein
LFERGDGILTEPADANDADGTTERWRRHGGSGRRRTGT